MEEIWKNIKDYEGLYQVSNLGRVKNVKRNKILNPRIIKGYLQVRLYKDNVYKSYFIHRLVAMTFPDLVDWTDDAKGKPFEVLQVNHKDEIKTNNCVDNLEWCNSSYNINYGTRNDKIRKIVQQFDLNGVLIKEYTGVRVASKQTGIPHSNIINCCSNKGYYKTAGGYIWKYFIENPIQ